MREGSLVLRTREGDVAAPVIDEALVRALVRDQFAHWAQLPVTRVPRDGWDNRSFRLGDDKVVRLPSAAAYAGQAAKEQRWLPFLGSKLSIPIPVPLGAGETVRQASSG